MTLFYNILEKGMWTLKGIQAYDIILIVQITSCMSYLLLSASVSSSAKWGKIIPFQMVVVRTKG